MPEETTQEPKPQPAQDQTAPAAETQTEQAEKSDLPACTFVVEEVGSLQRKITVTVPRKRIDAKFNEMFGELGQTAQVPGFRVGRAPRRLLEKRFGKEVGQDVRNALIGESMGKAIEDSKIKTLGEPNLGDLEKIELPEAGDLQFAFDVEVMPEFDLPTLKGIKVTRPAEKVDDARVDEAVDRFRQERAGHEATDSPAAEGDTVMAIARITGEGIAALERPGLNLRVAPGQIEGVPLVDLGTALAGKKAGQTAALKVTVPDAHPNEDWRGKELSFDVTVSRVSRRVLPSVEDTAKSLGFESVPEFRGHLRQLLEDRVDMEVKRAMREQIRQYLLENTRVELPPGILRTYATRALRRRYVQLLNAGVPKEQIDENLTRLQANVAEQSRRDLKLLLVMNRIAEENKVEVSEEEVNTGIAQMAQMYRRRPERLRHDLEREGALSAVSDAIRDDKILDMLLKDADVTEAPPEEPPAEEPQVEQAPAEEARPEEPPPEQPKVEPPGPQKAKAEAPQAEEKPIAKGATARKGKKAEPKATKKTAPKQKPSTTSPKRRKPAKDGE